LCNNVGVGYQEGSGANFPERGMTESAEFSQHAVSSVPRLARGTELIGEYEGSGFREPVFLVRRADGQVIRLSRLVYLVASETDGQKDFGQIALRVSEEFGRTVSPENIRYLVEERLRPLGVIATADGSRPELPRAKPVLALTFRASILPEGPIRALAGFLRPLFLPPVVVAVLAAFVALDLWLFLVHGFGQGARTTVYRPELFLMIFGLTALSGVFHEFGHATACHYGGARPGRIGVGIYLVWPVFFSDVTDAYRLGRIGRLRTDLGGIYFNVIFSLAVAGAYFLTGFDPLLLVILLQLLQMLYQFMPFVRLDGYYLVSDITGVPDLFARIKPILRSLVPGRESDQGVRELKPWVRIVVTAWVVMVIPALLYLFAWLVIGAPAMFTTAWDAFLANQGEVRVALGEGRILEGVAGLLRIVLLVIPVAGTTLIFALVCWRLGTVVWRRLGRMDETAVRNGTIVDLYFMGLYGRGSQDLADEVLARNCVLHAAGLTKDVQGPEEIKRHVETSHASFPDTQFVVEDQITEGDLTVVRWTSFGTREGDDASTANGGAALVKTTSFRIANGKIAEIWEDYDAVEQLHSPSDRKDGHEPLPSFRVIGRALVVYIVIPAILVYPVGLSVFAFQLLLSKNLEFLTAWYAASLVPATMIIGQGIKVLLVPLLTGLVVALATAHLRVWWLLRVRKQLAVTVTELEGRTRRTLMGLVGGTLVALAVAMLWLGPIPLFSAFTITFSLVPAVLVGGWSGILIASDCVRHTSRPERNTVLLGRHLFFRGLREGWIFRGLLWAYFGSALCASAAVLALAAVGQEPDLPRLIMSTRGERVGTPQQPPPSLLSHSGGYWHVLTVVETEGTNDDTGEDTILLSIPDNEVKRVTVIEDPVADVSITTRGAHGTAGWVGNVLAYELTTTNNGPDVAAAVKLVSEVPKGVQLVSATASQGRCSGEGNIPVERKVECELGNLSAGDATTVRFKVRPGAAGILSSTATVESEGYDYYGGNSKETNDIEAKLDAVPPDTRATVLPEPNSDGWHNTDVTVKLDSKDNAEGSGVEKIFYSTSGAQEIGEESTEAASAEISVASEGRTTVSYFTKDAAGNIETKASLTVGIDKTAPAVECEDPGDFWHKEDVSIPCKASDRISGLRDAANADFLLSTAWAEESISDGEEDDNVSTNSRVVCDKAGNCSTAGSIGDIKIDKKAPIVKIIEPSASAEYQVETSIDADYYCTDGGSGVDECKGSVSRGNTIDTSSIGPKTFEVEAKDKAGNTASVTHAYNVIYDFTSGDPIQLVEDPPSKRYITTAGHPILVTFGLGGDRGSNVLAAGYPRWREIECAVRAPSTTTMANNLQVTPDSSSGRYAYVWDTSDAWAGTCKRLVLKLNDGTQHSADFRFTE
jgi:putative peptide zinc metalloprotease protein